MIHARRAPVAATAALVNVAAAARWALDQDRDITVLCAGEKRAFSLEDAVCAGLLVGHVLAGAASADMTDAALAVLRLGEHYAVRLDRLAVESEWGRKLARQGRAADLDACLRLDASSVVPVFEGGVIVNGPRLPDQMVAQGRVR